MGLVPKLFGSFPRVDFKGFPPRNLIPSLMELPVMAATEWNREFIADFETDGLRLCKAQMMRIARLPPADEAGL